MEILGLGKINKVNDDFSIEFEIPGVATECIGYPMSTEDQPEENQTIVWFRIDSRILGETFIYKKLNIGYNNPIELKVGDYRIRVNANNGIILEYKEGNNIELNNDTVTINGHLKITK